MGLLAQRRGKQEEPAVGVRAYWRILPSGARVLTLEIRTDVVVSDFRADYSMNSSLEGYHQSIAIILLQFFYPSDPIVAEVFTFKLDAVEAVLRKEVEIAIPIALKYKLRTGEKRQQSYNAKLERGNSEFRVIRVLE